MHQPVRWNEWGEEAFALAQRENKPVLLDIGAVWCHWCHVMDRESYENAEIAGVINEHFIAVKVDRDERPDVDSRYQAAVQAISGQGGWPLTAFLTSDGRPFFGGTYFPPKDRYGRAGFKRVLLTLAQAFKEKGDEVEESAQGVMSAISRGEAFEGHAGTLNPKIVEDIVQSALKQFDPAHGGFGTQPKFPHPSTLDLMIDRYARTRDAELKAVIEKTLIHMAQGGVYDQLGGGFHRYSVDDKWVVPHFEKMSYDNSELLKNYAHAYQVFGEPFYASVAADIVRWMDSVLSDREHGGFYGSQDADINLDDDGDYFTWTVDELRTALDPPEAEIAAAYYDVEAVGEMHHNPAKNVLFVSASVEQLATRFRLSAPEVRERLSVIKRKMLDARARRPTPYIDSAVYVSWNALCISAYLAAARAIDIEECRQFALKSLDRVLQEAWNGESLDHVVCYPEGASPTRKVSGVLDDYAFTANACLDAYEVTSEIRYYEAAKSLADVMVREFHDEVGGAFFDTAKSAQSRIGALSAQRKPLQDTPTPAGNPSAAILLWRLHCLNGETHLRELAEKCLETFAGVASQFGYFASTYGLAVVHLLGQHTSLLVIGEDETAYEMLNVSRTFWTADSSVHHVRDAASLEQLPQGLRVAAAPLVRSASGKTVAILCTGNVCSAPCFDLVSLQTELMRSSHPEHVGRA